MEWKSKKPWLLGLLAVFLIPGLVPARAQMRPHHHPPMQDAFHMRMARWWDNPHMVQKLGLSAAQQKKMDQIYLDHKLKLIDLHAALEKQEALLGPMLGADQPNEGKILSQIDAIAQARANLEKEFWRMLLGIRRQLTPAQWQKLKVIYHEHMERMHHHGHPWHGPHSKAPMPPPPPGGSQPPAPQM
jgi:Spy/CpxP family protein refolding chaperone